MTFRSSSNDKSERPTIASLFSGGGLVEVGAIAAGFRPIWGVEFDPDKPELSTAIADCYETNIGAHIIRQRVQDVDWNQLQSPDLLWASPVCTRMSFANFKRGESEQDVELARSICSAIYSLKPKAFCLENVRAYSKSHSLQLIRDTLSDLGYGISEVVLNAASYGVPQSRIRFILRAVKGQSLPKLPSIAHQKVGWYKAIADILPTLPEGNLAPWQIERLPLLLKTKLGESLTRSSGIPSQDIPGAFLIERSGARSDRPLLVRGSDEPAWTLRASIGTDQNGNNRNAVMNVLLESGRIVALTNRALARLQTLPDSYWLPAQMKVSCPLISNGVPCELARVILSGIRPLLTDQNITYFDFQEVKHNMLAQKIQQLRTQEQQLLTSLDNLRGERKNLKQYQKVEQQLEHVIKIQKSLEAYSQLSVGNIVTHLKNPEKIGVITSLMLSPGGMPEAWVKWEDSTVSIPEQPNLLRIAADARSATNIAGSEFVKEISQLTATQSLLNEASETIITPESEQLQIVVPVDELECVVGVPLTNTAEANEIFDEITSLEQAERHRLELKVERAFYEAGTALRELRDKKLYRSTHKKFEEYCRDRFGFTRHCANLKILAVDVVDDLVTNGHQILPTTERQIRPITNLKPDERSLVWSQAVEQAGGKVPSSRIVKGIVERLKSKPLFKATDFCHPGDVFTLIGLIEQERKYNHCWAIASDVRDFTVVVDVHDVILAVKPENLQPIDDPDAHLSLHQTLKRIRRLRDQGDLDRCAYTVLDSLGKQTHLTDVEEKVLSCLEEHYKVNF